MAEDDREEYAASAAKGVDAVGFTLVVFAALVAAAGIYGISVIIDPSSQNLVLVAQRSEIVRNIGLFLLGVIGLPLAVWRSWIAKQQVDEAIVQGKRTERQLLHSERQLQATQATANLGLVEKGGSLLEAEKQAARCTGVMILQAVSQQEMSPVSDAATSILYQFVRHHENKKDALDYYLAVCALLYAWKIANREGKQNLLEIEDDRDALIDISNSAFDRIDFITKITLSKCSFNDCFFNNASVVINRGEITESNIVEIAKSSEANHFIRCDFSAAKMHEFGDNTELSDCYFYSDNPPCDEFLQKYGEQLTARDGASPYLKLPRNS